MAPFALNGSSSNLALEEIEVFSGEDHIWAEFQNNGDSLAFGARWAAFSRASVGPTLATSLDPGEGRAAEFHASLGGSHGCASILCSAVNVDSAS